MDFFFLYEALGIGNLFNFLRETWITVIFCKRNRRRRLSFIFLILMPVMIEFFLLSEFLLFLEFVIVIVRIFNV